MSESSSNVATEITNEQAEQLRTEVNLLQQCSTCGREIAMDAVRLHIHRTRFFSGMALTSTAEQICQISADAGQRVKAIFGSILRLACASTPPLEGNGDNGGHYIEVHVHRARTLPINLKSISQSLTARLSPPMPSTNRLDVAGIPAGSDDKRISQTVSVLNSHQVRKNRLKKSFADFSASAAW